MVKGCSIQDDTGRCLHLTSPDQLAEVLAEGSGWEAVELRAAPGSLFGPPLFPVWSGSLGDVERALGVLPARWGSVKVSVQGGQLSSQGQDCRDPAQAMGILAALLWAPDFWPRGLVVRIERRA